MSIESVKARMSELASRRSEVMKKPEVVFKNILEEKLGISSSPADTAGAAGPSSADAAAEAYFSNAALLNNSDWRMLAPTLQNSALNSGSYAGVQSGIVQQAQPYMDLIQAASAKYGLPASLIMGVIKAESDFNTNTVSYAGAMGLMQLMPENCEEDGVTDPYDPAQNIDAGSRQLARYLAKYNGDLKLALAAYNTGPGNVAKRGVTSSQSEAYLTIPQPVRDYVDRVLRYAGYPIV